MRRMMLGMSQEKLGDALGLTFQQVQKYEKGTNRIGASRLHRIAQVLEADTSFFFEGSPTSGDASGTTPAPTYVQDFLATSDGLALTKAFQLLPSNRLRKRVVALVEEMVEH
jgi:transcriptional regulator with XRE-family HTH domain